MFCFFVFRLVYYILKMNRAGLDDTTEIYQLCIDNQKQEDMGNEQQTSSAGEFEILLQPNLDLSPLLYLRAVEAELALQSLLITSVPLCFSRAETCQVYLEINPQTAFANKLFNKVSLEEDNRSSMNVAFTDYVCQRPEDVVDFMNDTFRYKLTHHFIWQYLQIFFDDDVLYENIESSLTLVDIKLILRYTDIALYTRHQLHKILTNLLGVKDDISKKITYSGKATDRLTTAQEKKIIEDSKCLKPTDKRKKTKTAKSIDFSLFNAVDLTTNNAFRTAVDTSIGKNTSQWIQDNDIDIANLTSEAKKLLNQVMTSNKELIDIGLIARKIIFTERERIDSRTKLNKSLFYHDLLIFDLDPSKQKIQFHIHPQQFLAKDTRITLYFPRKCSYTLGSDIGQDMIIGPIKDDMKLESLPRLTNRIMSPNQQLPLNLRHKAQICHLTSNIVTGKGIDQFMQNSAYDDHYIIYSHNIDESVMSNRCLVATDPPQRFLKIKQAHRILEKIEFKLLDENFQVCTFSRKTYTRLAFFIRPVTI